MNKKMTLLGASLLACGLFRVNAVEERPLPGYANRIKCEVAKIPHGNILGEIEVGLLCVYIMNKNGFLIQVFDIWLRETGVTYTCVAPLIVHETPTPVTSVIRFAYFSSGTCVAWFGQVDHLT